MKLVIRAFDDADESSVIELWSRCGLLRPWNDPHKDIERKKSVQRDLFLVGIIEEKIVAAAMGGYEGHRGWVNYLAVDPEYRRRGFGRAMMHEIGKLLRERGCPKINIQIRRENREAIAFYERIGFEPDNVVSYGKRLERDDA